MTLQDWEVARTVSAGPPVPRFLQISQEILEEWNARP